MRNTHTTLVAYAAALASLNVGAIGYNDAIKMRNQQTTYNFSNPIRLIANRPGLNQRQKRRDRRRYVHNK